MSFVFNSTQFDELASPDSSMMSQIMQSAFSNYYQWGVTIVNFLVQVVFIVTVVIQGLHKSSSFFKMHIILAVAIIIRSFFLIYINNCEFFVTPGTLPDLSQVSMIADFIVDTFKNILIFLMALNRCLSFTKRPAMEFLFDPRRYIFWVLISLTFSTVINVWEIISKRISRAWIEGLGFFDSAENMTDRNIWRALQIFPLFTIFCYVALYFHFKNMPKNKTSQIGSQSSAIHLYSSIILNLFCSFYAEFYCAVTNRLILKLYYCVNQSPEIALPLIFLVSNWRSKFRNRRVFRRRTSSKKTEESH